MLTKKPTSHTPLEELNSKSSKSSVKAPSSSQGKGHESTHEHKKTGKSPSPYDVPGLKGPKTRIVVKYDVGFENSVYLRGKGANLSWEKGVCLRNVKPDEWIWETDAPFTSCEFKVLINDSHYEIGENHRLSCGAHIYYTPKF